MAQVPDYLLQRSAERRAALGLPPYGSPPGATPPPPAAEGAEGGEAAAPAVPAPAGEAPAPAAAPAAPPPPAVPAEPEVPEYLPPLPTERSGIPAWVVPVLAIPPIRAIAYIGALSPPPTNASALTPIPQGG